MWTEPTRELKWEVSRFCLGASRFFIINMNEIRLELRIKNNILYRLIKKDFKSAAEFSRLTGVNANDVSSLLCLRLCPYSTRTGKPLLVTKKISEFFGLPAIEIFPHLMYKKFLGKALIVKEISIPQLENYYQERHNLAWDKIESKIDTDFLRPEINKSMDRLKDREKNILIKRFGLNGVDPQTLKSVAKDFNISKERTRQIEQTAIRKMRHPVRSKELRKYVTTDIQE